MTSWPGVKKLTKGVGVAVVYDAVGKDTFIESLDCLRPSRDDGELRQRLGTCAAGEPAGARASAARCF